MLRVPLARGMNGVTEAFDLSQCTDVTVSICNSYKRTPLVFSMDESEKNVLLARVEGDTLSLGTYSLEVKGKLNGNDWRSFEENIFEIINGNASADSNLEKDDKVDVAMVIVSPDHLGNVASKNDIKAVRQSVKKLKSKAKVVCRKAISLGATKANGNLVKYFSYQPKLRLVCGERYRIHVNGTILGDEEIGVYSANIHNTQITTGGGKVISVQGEGGARTACVNIMISNRSPAKVTWVEKVEENNGVLDVYLKMKTVDSFSSDTPSPYFKIIDGHVKGVIQDVEIPFWAGDLQFSPYVPAGNVVYYRKRSCPKNASDGTERYGHVYRFRKHRGDETPTGGGRILAVVKRKGKVICKKEFVRWVAPSKQNGNRYFAKEIGW